jgi:Tol biopolymer transport system component
LVRIVDGSNELIRVRLADGAEQALTSTPEREETWPYWSSVAKRLVFQVSRGGSDSDLMLWSPEAGETPLVETPRREERWPAWSPRRAALVYAFRGGHPAAGLVIADLETGERRIAARSGPRDFFFRPSFSPDGSQIVAQRRGPSGRGSLLWLVETGSPPRPLTGDPAWLDTKARFSRDGEHVLFSRRAIAGGPRDVVSIARDGGDPRTLASSAEADDHSAQPSPARDEIAFVSNRDGQPEIFLADLDGSDVRKLTRGGLSSFSPRWSLDGARLVVIATEPDAPEPRLGDRASLTDTRVVVLDREGNPLLDVPGFMPDWMPPWR